jgi:hypothetical protein
MNFRRIKHGLWAGHEGFEVKCINDNHMVRYAASYKGVRIGAADSLTDAQKLCDKHVGQLTRDALAKAWG